MSVVLLADSTADVMADQHLVGRWADQMVAHWAGCWAGTLADHSVVKMAE